MAKFIVVDTPPPELRKDEYVVTFPNFMEEISAVFSRMARRNVTTTNMLKTLVGEVVNKYSPETIALSMCPYGDYEGLPVTSDEDVSKIMTLIFKNHAPAVLGAVVEHQIKNRPFGTKVIYYVGPFNSTSMFYKHGIEQVQGKDVEVELGLKKKKIIGKPAISNEEIELLKQQAQDQSKEEPNNKVE